MWRQWYCVLNGHLLLFYRTESEFNKLGKFHDQIDLGLVYDVTPALGVENGIQISTHVGPHWLVYLVCIKIHDRLFIRKKILHLEMQG